MTKIEKEVTNNHKGALAEALFDKYNEVTEEELPDLHELIHTYLEENMSEEYEKSEEFYIDVYHDEHHHHSYFPVNPFKEWDFGFTPDLIITVSMRDGDTFEEHGNAVFPVEIKTGSSANIRSNQKQGLHEWTQRELKPGCGIYIRVDIRDLPETFSYTIRVLQNNGWVSTDWRETISQYNCEGTHCYFQSHRPKLSYTHEEYGYVDTDY